MTDPFDQKPKLVGPGLAAGPSGSDEAPTPVDLDLKGATSLKTLLADYTFYTPALLHLSTPLTFDPFDVFCSEYGQPVARFTLRFDNPIFSGLVHPLGDASWNYVLFGMENEHWPAYLAWFGTIAFNDSEKGILRRVRSQDLTLLDPLAKANGLQPEPIPVTAFAIDTNKGSFYFKPTLDWRPQAVFDKDYVYDQTIAFANALKDGCSDPYKYIDKHAR